MDQQQSKKMLEELLSATSAAEVDSIVKQRNFSENNDWNTYGNRPKNWDIISNQQANAVGAFTELVTNAIDAVLIRKAEEAKISELGGKDAPKSMADAVQKFYGVNEGKLSYLETKERTKIAEESILVAAKRAKGGKNAFPTITIVDFGTGQKPKDFPSTFLSLSEENKEGIAFVQGKFNMGSTGSIRFCTRSDINQKHYKLIASKHYESRFWGWTLIKAVVVQEGQKLPVVKYLMPDGEIPNFAGDHIEAFGDSEIGRISQGSMVRLFEYDFGSLASQVDPGMSNALTLNLLECALPIRIFDFRAKAQESGLRARGIAPRTFSGMGVDLRGRLVDSNQESPPIPTEKPEDRTTEFIHLVADERDPKLGQIRIYATGISEINRQDKKGSRKNKMLHTQQRLFYTINGQTHATENASFFNRIRLGDLQNHLIVNVQCEDMNKTALTIFMGNREQKVDNPMSRKLEAIVKERLQDDAKLKEYQNIIRLRRASQITEEDEDAKKLLSDYLTQDPNIRSLLGLGDVFAKKLKPGGKEPWVGKQYPTRLVPKRTPKENGRCIKEVPISSVRKIQCETDAENQYLSRAISPGRFHLAGAVNGLSVNCGGTHNGTATFVFTAPDNAVQGSKMKLDVGFVDDVRNVNPLTFPVTIKIVGAETKKKKQGGKRTSTKEKLVPSVADPTRWVEEEYWGDFEFDENSGATVRETEHLEVHVNRAHRSLAEMRSTESDEAKVKVNEMRFRMCLGLLTLAVYRDRKKQDDPDAETVSRKAADAMAPFVLPLIKTLGGAETF